MDDLTRLLERMSERHTAYVPDIGEVLVRGRRLRTRVHLGASAAAVAAVLATGAATVLLPGGGDAHRQPASSPAATAAGPSAADPRIAASCAKQHDGTSATSAVTGKKVYEPKPAEVRTWRVTVSDSNASGTSAVLLSPNGRFYAVCSFAPPQWQGGPAAAGIDFFPVTSPRRVPTGWRDGIAPIGRADTCDPKGKGKPARCVDEVWAGAGRLPGSVARLTVRTPDGATGEVKVRDGYFAYRHLSPYRALPPGAQPGSGSGQLPPVILAMYDANGRRLVSYNQNYQPPIPPGQCPRTGGC